MMELRECPFCGSSATIQYGGFGEVMARCSNKHCDAGLGGGCWQTAEEEAARAWNRRAAPDGYNDALERAARCCEEAYKGNGRVVALQCASKIRGLRA